MQVISKVDLNYIKGANDRKHLYNIDDKYYVITIKDDFIVFDHKYKDNILKYNWCIGTNGYCYAHDQDYMHRNIVNLSKIENYDNKDLSVDHINWIKLDNREINLRMATQSVQNSNRASRCDKKEPNQELKDAGIIEFPKYVSWNNTDKKFIIDSHPKLVQDVKAGLRKKATMNGSKSVKLSIEEKYKDILARLQELNETITNNFNEVFKQRKSEYNEICNIIRKYEGTYVELPDLEQLSISPKRNTAPNRKGVSKLPDNCSVTIEQIPKYCYYSPKTDKRGDLFSIDRSHPSGKRWSTTSTKNKTTLEKFNELIEKYESL